MSAFTGTQSANETNAQQMLTTVALNLWKQTIERADKTFSALTDEQLQKQIAPGKNRVGYVWGHLIAANDYMIQLLGIGERVHPELQQTFVTNPDDRANQLPSAEQLKSYWNEVNAKVLAGISAFSPEEWIGRHNAVSEEDFAKEPTRNRFAVLLSRIYHLGYHTGQVITVTK
jgi:DinB family protein